MLAAVVVFRPRLPNHESTEMNGYGGPPPRAADHLKRHGPMSNLALEMFHLKLEEEELNVKVFIVLSSERICNFAIFLISSL